MLDIIIFVDKICVGVKNIFPQKDCLSWKHNYIIRGAEILFCSYIPQRNEILDSNKNKTYTVRHSNWSE